MAERLDRTLGPPRPLFFTHESTMEDTPEEDTTDPVTRIVEAVGAMFPFMTRVRVTVCDPARPELVSTICFDQVGDGTPTDLASLLASLGEPPAQEPRQPGKGCRHDQPRFRPAERRMLELLRDHPGLKGAAIAKRLDVEEVTARRRLGTLVRYGWVTSSYAVGYHITEAGLDVLAGWDLQQERP